MTTENLPDDEHDVSEKNSSTEDSGSSNTERTTHKDRRKSRRSGGRSGGAIAQTTDAPTDDDNSTETAVATTNAGTEDTAPTAPITENAADEAALAEGGIKTLGNQKIINFMKIEKPMAIISGLMVIISIIAIAVNGLNLGLDFTGGVSADVTYNEPVDQIAVTQALADNGFDDAVVQYLGNRQELLVRLPPQETTNEGLSELLDDALHFDGKTATVENVNIIGSQVGNEVYINSILAMALALFCMLIYVALRFQFKLSIGAVLALFHDTVVTLGVFAILGWPFDLTVLAAILALIGYSLNDTIVVYDRIRENFRRIRGLNPRAIVDVSLTETLRRTFMTSMTVLLVVWAMMILGGDGLYWFAVTLFIGLIVGTYSSVYIASAIPLMMGMSRDDFVVVIKPEFAEDSVIFEDRNAVFDEDDFYDELDVNGEFNDDFNGKEVNDVAKISNNTQDKS